MEKLQGLVVVGRYGGDAPKVYGSKHPTKAGQPVPGMREVRVLTERRDGSDFVHALGYFPEDFDGEESRFARNLSRFEGQEGDLVAVAVRTKVSGEYVNLDPVSILLVARGDELDVPDAPLSAVG